MAASSEIHKKINLTPSEISKYGSEVSFMGAGYPNRHKLFENILDFDLKIWGTGWENNSRLLPFLQKNGERVSIEESVKIFNSSKININIHSSMNDKIFDINDDFINPRTFEIAACGGFQLVDRRKPILKLFEEDKEIVTFSSVDEMRDKIKFYLKNDSLRNQIAENGRKKVLNFHTYEKRLEEMIQLIWKSNNSLQNRVLKRISDNDNLLKSINDKNLEKFWHSLNLDEKNSIDKIVSKIENLESVSEVETKFLALQTFMKFM